MPSTTFSNGTVVQAQWLNDVDAVVFDEKVNITLDPYSAVGDGVTDNLTAWSDALDTGRVVYLPPGTFYLSDYYRPQNGQDIFLIGAGMDLTTVICANNRIPIFCDRTVGTDIRVNNVYVKGITFDGRHTRTPASYPYNGDSGASMTQALNLRGPKSSGENSRVLIEDCRFKRINGLPVWIADFSSVTIRHCHFLKTKDPGILYNDNVHFHNNLIEFSADNGVSVSRANKYIHVHDNTFLDCASSGIFAGGISISGSTTVTVSGATYTAGNTLTLTSNADVWNTEDVGNNVILRSGANRALLRITSVSSKTVATVVALLNVPAALQAVGTADWDLRSAGAQSGSIHDNVVEGGSAYGINLTGGGKDLVVHSNSIRRTGITRDSETYTTGTVASGSTTLTVADGSDFADGDWIIIDPDYTMENYFIAQISSGGGTNTLTLSTSPGQTMANEKVWRAYRRTAAYGILAIGAFESSSIFEFAENIKIYDNVIVDSVAGGIRAGSSSGAVRDLQIHNNQINLRQTAHVDSTIYGILIGDQGTTAMRTVRVDVDKNTISLATSGVTSFGVRYNPVDNSSDSYIRIGDNNYRLCDTNVSVIEQAGSTNITVDYMPHSVTGTRPTYTLLGMDTAGFSSWAAATFNAGVMTTTQTLNVYTADNGGATTTVTDFALSSINHATPFIIIRNSGATAGDTITITHNINKIRTITGADVVIPRHGAATFVPVSSTVWQQV